MSLFRYRIVHPTDLSDSGEEAFEHALRLATLLRAELHLLHVDHGGAQDADFDHFPRVRDKLTQWGLIEDHTAQHALEERIGIHVNKFNIHDRSVADGVQHYVEHKGAQLVVLATHGRDGLDHVIHGSIAEEIAAHITASVLFLPLHRHGFVDRATGNVSLKRILVPVAMLPDPHPALQRLTTMAGDLHLDDAVFDFIHVGSDVPVVRFGGTRTARTLSGDIIESILTAATGADLIVMPTEGRNSILDNLRGTTTERVIRHAPCPVLAIPAAGPSD